jgi:RsbT co-antagonist protein rsbRD N-terminal domain
MTQAEIARLIETHRDELVKLWAAAVREDKSIQSDADLSEGGLIDHVPMLLDEVCDIMHAGQMPAAHNTHEARVHAYTRFRQGYRARDLVREVALLRLLVIDHIRQHLPADYEQINLADYFNAVYAINLYLDEELRYGVAIYTESNGLMSRTTINRPAPTQPTTSDDVLK